MFAYPSMKESIAYASRKFSTEVANYHYLFSYDPKWRGLGGYRCSITYSDQQSSMLMITPSSMSIYGLMFSGAVHGLDVVLMFGPFETYASLVVTNEARLAFRSFLRDIAYNG